MAGRLREYEVEIRPGRWQRMKLNPQTVEQSGDSRRIREVKAKATANKGRQPANKAAGV